MCMHVIFVKSIAIRLLFHWPLSHEDLISMFMNLIKEDEVHETRLFLSFEIAFTARLLELLI